VAAVVFEVAEDSEVVVFEVAEELEVVVFEVAEELEVDIEVEVHGVVEDLLEERVLHVQLLVPHVVPIDTIIIGLIEDIIDPIGGIIDLGIIDGIITHGGQDTIIDRGITLPCMLEEV
jgi:hypothetical protein